MRKIKLLKIVGNLLRKLRKLYMNNGTVYLEIFSLAQAIENSRQFLFLRTDILQKTVVGCPCFLNDKQSSLYLPCPVFPATSLTLSFLCLHINAYKSALDFGQYHSTFASRSPDNVTHFLEQFTSPLKRGLEHLFISYQKRCTMETQYN